MNALFSCFTEAIATIRKKIPWIIVFSVAIVIGIILGVVISKPLSVRGYYEKYCRAYADSVFASSVFKLFFKRLISSLLLFLLICPLFFTPFYLPAAILIAFFKGYTFGAITVILLTSYGVSGLFLWLICSLPVALVSFFFFACASAIALSFPRCKIDGAVFRERATYCLLLLVAAAICAFLELILTALLFRPISKIF